MKTPINPSTEPLYFDSPFIINPAASAADIADGLSERIDQARALTMAMSGDDGQGLNDFYSLNFELRSNYVWALDRKISEIGQLFIGYEAKLKEEGKLIARVSI